MELSEHSLFGKLLKIESMLTIVLQNQARALSETRGGEAKDIYKDILANVNSQAKSLLESYEIPQDVQDFLKGEDPSWK